MKPDRLRKLIAQFLARASQQTRNYPGGYAGFDTIYAQLHQQYSDLTQAEFTRALEFLADKNYIEVNRGVYYRATQEGQKFAGPLGIEGEEGIGLRTGGGCSAIIVGIVLLVFAITAVSLKLPKTSIPLSNVVSLPEFNVVTSKLGDMVTWRPMDVRDSEITFLLSAGSPVIETESHTATGNAAIIYIPVQRDNITTIHLLMNLSHTHSQYLGGQSVVGQPLARVRLVIAGRASQEIWDMYAGYDIRDWIVEEGSVSTVGESAIWASEFWTGQSRSGQAVVIDRLVLAVPEELQREKIEYVTIEDLSGQVLAQQDPGVMIFGMAIETQDKSE